MMSRQLTCVASFPTMGSEITGAAGHFNTAAYYRLGLNLEDDFGHKDLGKGYVFW